MPRAAKPTGKSRHDPLHVQIGEDEVYAKYGRVSRPGKRSKTKGTTDEEEDNGEVSCSCFFPGDATTRLDSHSYR